MAPTGTVSNESESANLEALLESLGVVAWDIVLIGDGSGSNWSQEIGWACVSFEKHIVVGGIEKLVWYGGANRGTVNFAEIMAYLQPLTYFASREDDRRKAGKSKTRAYNVHIITDSQYCRDTGRTRSAMVAKNSGLWSCLNALTRQGLVLHWHWLKRDSCQHNTHSDELSRKARLLLAGSKLHDQCSSAVPSDIT